MTSLKEDIAQFNKDLFTQVSTETLNTMGQATSTLRATNIENNALKTNDSAPHFNLNNHQQESKSLENYLKDSLLVLTFYRGGWCPYCNMELNALQKLLPEIEKNGAKLIAISPEIPDLSLSTAEKNKLHFDILYDQNNAVAKQFGLVFKLPEALRPIYDDFNIDISKHNGNDFFELPLPATYIINQQGKIIYHFIDVDYTQRAEPTEIVKVLAGI